MRTDELHPDYADPVLHFDNQPILVKDSLWNVDLLRCEPILLHSLGDGVWRQLLFPPPQM
jgi:hypothetical protein